MAVPQLSLAAPLHVQHLEKALRLDPFLSYLEGVFTDPYSTNISDDSELSDNEEELLSKEQEGLLNGSTDVLPINGSLSRDGQFNLRRFLLDIRAVSAKKKVTKKLLTIQEYFERIKEETNNN